MEQRKGKKQKALLAASLGEKKDTTRSSIEQFANRLEIEHPAGLREATTLHRTSKEGAKSIAADEKMPISQTWYHSMKIKKKTFVFSLLLCVFILLIQSINTSVLSSCISDCGMIEQAADQGGIFLCGSHNFGELAVEF